MGKKRNDQTTIKEQIKVNDGESIFPNFLYYTFGYGISIVFGLAFAIYLRDLHEVTLFFSNIRKIEQEISLRTESGLYYSYFKEILQKPTIALGIQALLNDTRTEYPRAINILERFNVYQEVLLAILYRAYDFNLAPMLFYVYWCFAFAGLQVFAIFHLSWTLSKSVAFPVLACSWLFYNLDETTRAYFSVNLRENFSLPFLFLQTVFLCQLLIKQKNFMACGVGYVVSTWLFCLFWQFNQFILIFQSVSLLAITQLSPNYKSQVKVIIFLQCVAFALTILCQFFQKMLVGSIGLSLNVAILLLLAINKVWTGKLNRYISIITDISFVVLVTACLNTGTKYGLKITSDTHIWTFVKAKLGLSYEDVTFESALYLCHGAFAFLDEDFFVRTSKSGVFVLYCVCVFVEVYSILKNFIQQKQLSGDEVVTAFLVIQSIPTGLMAYTTLRMKYIWFPQMAILASHVLYKGKKLIGLSNAKVLAIAIAFSLLYAQYGVYKEQMTNEQEFFDEDTVDLMLWIGWQRRDAVFTGSMQLMAGVKACTGRNILNHPHFEDQWIRNRTKRLYSIYGRKSIKRVHQILKKEKADFVIIEDSICLAPSTGCSTNDLVDFASGLLPDNGLTKFGKNLKEKISEERFCEAIRSPDPSLERYFILEHSNPTFRVYKINHDD